MKALIGTKLGMTRIFDEEGRSRTVTVIQAGPCVVTQVKTRTTDGYNAVQLGYGEAPKQKRPMMGHLKASGANAAVLREVRVDDVDGAAADAEAQEAGSASELALKVGAKLDVSTFEVGDAVEVEGVSKGKGFAGTIKRHNFARGPKTHGSHNYRQPGSIGSMYPEHVFKGMRMAGRMGHDQVTVRGLKVVLVDAENNLLGVSGAVPGPRKGIVVVRG